jgi:pimeloyl-ACP methyl ester carboxylesterase
MTPPRTADIPVRHERALVNDVLLHYVTAGEGPPVVLLHGFPETSAAWRKVLPLLGADHTVVAPDLRGLGHSHRPDTGYDKMTVAADIVALLEHLGHPTARVVGHDMGGAVAYAMAAAHPERVTHLAVLEMLLPGFGLEESIQLRADGQHLWHIPFNASVETAAALVAGREELYLDRFYRASGPYDPTVFAEADIAEYLRCYKAPGAMRAAFQWYRALYQDAEDNRRAAATGPLTMPVLAVGGSYRIGAGVARSLRAVARDVVEVVLPRCGHYPHEEQPEQVAELLRELFAR